MNNKLLVAVAFTMISAIMMGQDIKGQFSSLSEKTIRLEGFNGFSSYVIDSIKADESGKFNLNFSNEDYGMGFISSKDGKPLFVVLANEEIVLEGEAPDILESVTFKQGKQNQAFVAYASEQPKREQALNAWNYLQKMYAEDSLFNKLKTPKKGIDKEIQRIYKEEVGFLSSLPSGSYVKWFLPVRKLVSNVSVVAQYRPEDIPSTLKSLREIDYADDRLYKSGLFKQVIENHVWFVENSSGGLDEVYADLNTSIDMMYENLVFDQEKCNEVTDFLFNLLEKRSLFTSAEYLALKMLNEERCTIEDDVAKQLEAYRKMKRGSQVPDISFGQATYYPEHAKPVTLYELDSDYTVVVFAAGWCGHCVTSVPKIADLYTDLQNKDIEVVMVSLDETPKDFAKFAAPFPFISTTSYEKWESKAVKDYNVYATPSMFLLDKDKKIVLRLKSVDHLKAWMDTI